MARDSVLLEISSDEFAFLSKQVGAASLNSNTTASQDKTPVPVVPSWVENFWAMEGNRLSACVKIDTEIEALPSAAISAFTNTGTRTYVVAAQSESSYLLVNSSGWYALDDGTWTLVRTPTTSDEPSVYNFKRNTDILEPGIALLNFNPANATPNEFSSLTDITSSLVLPTGLTIANIISACAAINYRILVTVDTVLWSAPENDVYFQNGGTGLNALAGFAAVVGITSPIIHVQGTEDGFYIFTRTNIVKATYSQNPNNPWIFDVVRRSSGTLTRDHILINQVRDSTFIWSNTGFAALENQQQTLVVSELTELLAGDILESYNTADKVVETASTGLDIELQIMMSSSRTLVISYGNADSVNNYILLYDILTQKWSRLNVPHLGLIDIFKVTRGGLLFDDWTFNFEDTIQTFESMFTDSVNPQYQTSSVGIIGTDGKIYRITPIDIYTGTVGLDDTNYEVLPNVIHFEAVRKTRKSINELNELIVHNGYPTYPDASGNPNTQTVGGSESVVIQSELPTGLVSFQHRRPEVLLDDETSFVGTCQGNRLKLSIENINSTSGVELVSKKAGRSWL